MAVYDLEEQDQLDDLKAWWARWRNPISAAIIVASIGVIGFQGWRWWTGKQAEEAAALFGAVTQAARANDLAKAKDAVAQLTDKFAGTGYAPRAAFFLARMDFDAGDIAGARAQLQWVIEHAGEPELQEVARYRLAALQLNEKQFGEALKTLDAKHGESFDGLYADLRGDALAASGRTGEARTAYQSALAKFDPKSPYRGYVQVKLESLGADPAAAGSTPPAAAGIAPAPIVPPQPAGAAKP
jgi:predicted negative regulator of RcsB-dependent stress response